MRLLFVTRLLCIKADSGAVVARTTATMMSMTILPTEYRSATEFWPLVTMA